MKVVMVHQKQVQSIEFGISKNIILCFYQYNGLEKKILPFSHVLYQISHAMTFFSRKLHPKRIITFLLTDIFHLPSHLSQFYNYSLPVAFPACSYSVHETSCILLSIEVSITLPLSQKDTLILLVLFSMFKPSLTITGTLFLFDISSLEYCRWNH